MDIFDLLKMAIDQKASDLHITVAVPPMLRINGSLHPIGNISLTVKDTEDLVKQILGQHQMDELEKMGELDLSFSNPDFGRFRANTFKQRGTYSMVIRMVGLTIPSMENLGLPAVLKEMSRKQRGLILVTGPTGSGKTTTMASMIDLINKERQCHILTLEDPIEYLHRHNKSIVNQREIRNDSLNFTNALRAALRQDPDVILVGEMRDLETISIAITAAETGHLVLSTLHTLGAAKTIDRIIDVFPPHQQQQIRIQMSAVLEGVVSQQLLPTMDERGRTVAVEVMVATPAIRNLIREGKTHQIMTSIQTGGKFGMQTMDHSLLDLYKRKLISKDTTLTYAMNEEIIRKGLDL